MAAAALLLAILGAPVLAGLAAVVAPAFGYMPGLGGTTLSLTAWQSVVAWPGLGRAVRLSVVTGIGATVISLALAVLIVAAWQGTRSFGLITRSLAPLLALPHAAAAFGLAFLIAPSGWIARAFSPWATGWDRPPDLLIVNDPHGIALIAGLVIKEVPFLMLMILAALGQSDSLRRALVAQALGYGRVTGWLKTVFPAVYAQIRLPVYAVLAYSMSVVDVALILGPTRPPTLAVQILEWMTHPDLSMRFQASAGAVLQLLLVIAALGMWRLGEGLVTRAGRGWATNGHRGARAETGLQAGALALTVLLGLALAAGMAGLAVWSFAGLWRFPDILPQVWTFRNWTGQSGLILPVTGQTALIGGAASVIALACTVLFLQLRGTGGHGWSLGLIYLPLIMPQIAFVPGLASLALVMGLDGTVAAVLCLHLVFVLPYVFLVLADPWSQWDARAGLIAQSLGARPWRVLWCIRLPMLTRAILVAGAVGFATSVAQYLPTLLIGAGRITTVTTEAVALASSGNRRLIGVWAVLQMALPVVVFIGALAVPAILFRHRKGMRI